MAISSGIAINFKEDCLEGVHHFSSATFKIALYTSIASLSNGTSVFLVSGELASGNGYTSGGQICTVTNVTVDGSTAIVDFADQSWTSATFTARGCLIYNSSQSNKTVAVIDFGGEKTATNGTFTIQMPAAAAATAIVRLA